MPAGSASDRDHEGHSARALPRILVLMGGPDAERDVSLMSGAEIVRALRETGEFEVLAHTVDRTDADGLRAEILAHRPDAIFPIVHGPFGEGGPLQEILETIAAAHGIGYVGPKPRPAAVAMHKLATKQVASSVGVRTPRSREIHAGEPLDLAPPLVLKPSNDGSSVDLRICRTADEVAAARAELAPKRPHLMAEDFIEGREMTVGIIDGEVLPIIEIVPAVEFYDYQAKYFRDDTRYVVDPAISAEAAEEMRSATKAVFTALGLRDVARADFIVDARGAWFLEINTAPGMTTHSLVPMASRHRGVEMPELCARLARAAIARGGRSRPAAPHAPSAAPHAPSAAPHAPSAAQHAPFAASPSTPHATSQAGS